MKNVSFLIFQWFPFFSKPNNAGKKNNENFQPYLINRRFLLVTSPLKACVMKRSIKRRLETTDENSSFTITGLFLFQIAKNTFDVSGKTMRIMEALHINLIYKLTILK